jgi:RNA polymerase sigma factor (sigma-70 family)
MSNPLDDPNNQKKINDFIVEHAPLINLHIKKLMASGKIPENVDPSDLHMAGFQGLMEALHRYDPKIGASFSTYAGTRINGKMLDHVASQDYVPKTARIQAKNIKALNEPQQVPISANAAPSAGRSSSKNVNQADKYAQQELEAKKAFQNQQPQSKPETQTVQPGSPLSATNWNWRGTSGTGKKYGSVPLEDIARWETGNNPHKPKKP